MASRLPLQQNSKSANQRGQGSTATTTPLSQGSVLSLPLFLLYIDDHRRVVFENVVVAMFADNVSLLSSHPNKEVAEAAIQGAISNVAESVPQAYHKRQQVRGCLLH